MTNDQIIATLRKWQQDGRKKSRGVFVKYYYLQPQAKGFLLSMDLHVDGMLDNEESLSVYGDTLSEIFDKAIAFIEQKKDELRKALDE